VPREELTRCWPPQENRASDAEHSPSAAATPVGGSQRSPGKRGDGSRVISGGNTPVDAVQRGALSPAAPLQPGAAHGKAVAPFDVTEILHSPLWQASENVTYVHKSHSLKAQGAGETASAASPVRAHAHTHRQHGSIGLISSVVGWDGAMRALAPARARSR
jgi:hypothetical protein